MGNFKYTVLWTDDEIDLLMPHIIFLENKGFKIIKSNSGNDAINILNNNKIDIIILDENMPGLGGIETLEIIKENGLCVFITSSLECKCIAIGRGRNVEIIAII